MRPSGKASRGNLSPRFAGGAGRRCGQSWVFCARIHRAPTCHELRRRVNQVAAASDTKVLTASPGSVRGQRGSETLATTSYRRPWNQAVGRGRAWNQAVGQEEMWLRGAGVTA